MKESRPPYSVLASFYEELSDNRDWDAWVHYVWNVLNHERLPVRGAASGNQRRDAVRILDAACGTGRIARALVDRGAHVVGVDASAAMLAEAAKKRQEEDDKLRLYQQDLRELALPETFDAAICLCDSLNYLLEPSELETAFRRIAAHLEPGGFFLFDMDTEWKLANIYGDYAYGEHREGFSLIWENAYDPLTATIEMKLAFFIQEPDGRYVRYDEVHRQRAYPKEVVVAALQRAGFRLIGSERLFGLEPPEPVRERIFYLAQKVQG